MAGKPGTICFVSAETASTQGVDFCDPSLNLLAHAQAIELEIGSRCGGHGECGGDRLRVIAPAGSLSGITAAEREHLSAAEIASGFRLACQCWPERADSHIECEIPRPRP